jgi:hypothetical protein
MSEEPAKGTKTQLALAIAQGVPVAAWARSSGVSRRTAFYWAKHPEVRKMVLSCRRRVLDRAVGRMTKQSNEAVDTIVRISKEGDTDSVRLRAARAVLSDMIAVSSYSGLEERVTELEERIERPDGAASDVRGGSTPPR